MKKEDIQAHSLSGTNTEYIKYAIIYVTESTGWLSQLKVNRDKDQLNYKIFLVIASLYSCWLHDSVSLWAVYLKSHVVRAALPPRRCHEGNKKQKFPLKRDS